MSGVGCRVSGAEGRGSGVEGTGLCPSTLDSFDVGVLMNRGLIGAGPRCLETPSFKIGEVVGVRGFRALSLGAGRGCLSWRGNPTQKQSFHAHPSDLLLHEGRLSYR